MTPGIFNIPFYNGAAWSFELTFKDKSKNPLDLTGKGPFLMTIVKKEGEQIIPILEVESTGTYDTTGKVTFSVTKSQTVLFPIGKVSVGVTDNADLPYMFGDTCVYEFPVTPTP